MMPTPRTPDTTSFTYTLEGLTCSACLAEVMEAVRALPHVTSVAVDLVAHGRSALVVRSDVSLLPQVVIDAVQGAGFRAFPVGKRRARHLQRTFTGRAQDLHFGAGT